MNSDVIILLSCIFGVLITGSLAGFFLTRRASTEKQRDTVENLNARVKAWWIMVIVLAIAFAMGATGVILLFAICSLAALREFLTLTNTKTADHRALAAAVFVVLPIQYVSVAMNWYGFYSIFIPVYAFLLIPVLAALRGQTDNFLIRISETQWALMISVFCVSHVPALLSLNIADYDGKNLFLIFFLLVVVQSSDVLQYVWGKLLGKHKVAPSLSPSKTWEGLIGGCLSASLVGAALHWVTPFTILQAAGLSIIITAMGFLGGLVMSAIKRDRGVKDWGHLIPGHGGFIDRLDSVIFSAPIFFHVVRFYWDIH